MGIELTVLDCGMLDADRALIHPGDDSHRRVLLPIPAILLRGERTILVDTGCPLVAADNPEGLRNTYGIEPAWMHPLISRQQRIDEALRLAGTSIEELDMVVSTHFHFDHAGGNALFAGVHPIVVQGAEIEAAQQSDDYMPVWDAPGLQFEAVEGDWSPMPGVEFLFTPGHTPGHQSLLVRLEPQPWLFTVDVVYTEEHWRENRLGAVQDVASARRSLERIREVAGREGAKIVFGHDIGQWDSLPKAERSSGSLA